MTIKNLITIYSVMEKEKERAEKEYDLRSAEYKEACNQVKDFDCEHDCLKEKKARDDARDFHVAIRDAFFNLQDTEVRI